MQKPICAFYCAFFVLCLLNLSQPAPQQIMYPFSRNTMFKSGLQPC